MTIFKRITAALLMTALVLTMAACGKTPEETAPTTAQTAEETQAPVETTLPDVTIPAPKPDVEIVTPYGTMLFPGDWAVFLRTETTDEEPMSVLFLCCLEDGRELPVFTVTFGGKMEEAIGAVKSADGRLVAVSVEENTFVPDDTFTESDINIVFNVKNCLNPVLESLNLQEPVIEAPAETKPAETKPAETKPGASETLPPEMRDDMAIDTPYGELHYPVKWAEYLSVEVDESNGYSVAFYCALEDHVPALLFTIHFGGTQGAVVTKISDKSGGTVEVRVSFVELDLDESWIDNDVGIAYSMQEDINYLLKAITG